MATSKVGSHPPATSKVKLSRYGPPMSGMNGVNGVLDTDSLVAKSSNLHLTPNHCVFRASSFPPFLSARLCAIPTLDCDCGVCEGDVKIANHGLFGIFGSLCFQHPMPPRPWSVQHSSQGSVNPTSGHRLQCLCFTSEPIVAPAFSHFEVLRSCHQHTGSKGYLTDSQSYDQVGKQHGSDSAGFPVSVTTTNGINSTLPYMISPLSAHVSHVEATGDCSEKFSDIISRSHGDDETSTCCKGIHGGGNDIHVDYDSDQASEYYSDCERGDDEHVPGADATCTLSVPTEFAPSVLGVAKVHLTANDSRLQLKKLLSDESGYCESALSDVPTSPCDWSQKDADMLNGDVFEEWDEDGSTGGFQLECSG